MKKTLSLLLAVIMIAMTFTVFPITVGAATVDTAATAEGKVINVGTADELKAACTEINTNGGNYTISLTTDIENGYIDISNSSAVVTVYGNGNSISHNQGYSAIVITDGATVNLGSADGGDKNALTIVSSTDNDDPGIVFVSRNSTCCMYDKVTLKDHKGNNYIGGGVTVEGGTFHMHGGTIKNCGIDGGSVCYGGGVAVFSDGTFIMDDGVITECYANSDYIDDYDPNRCFTAMGGGVFVTAGSEFTMNGGTISNCEATNFGGGIAMTTSDNYTNYSELKQNGFGKPQSTVTINDGTITANSADEGAGVFVSGFFYSYAAALAFTSPESGSTTQPGLYINGSTISNNEANDMGGGILIAMLRSEIKAQIHNAEIKNNTADNGAGIENFGYWTQLDIDGCTITGNTAVTNGGGVMLSTNTSGGYTNLKNTTVTGNTSGDRGAGVYYDNNSKLNISGANVIQNNTYNGVLNNLNVLSLAKPVYVIGDLTGSQIGLSDPTLWDDGLPDEDAEAVSTEYLTSGYKANNPEVHPSEYFTSDHETWIVDRSEQTKEETVDPSSVTYREYTVNRYPYIPASDPKLNPLYGQNNEYVYSEINNPDIDKISSFNDLYNEMKYKYSDTSKYTKSTDVNNNGNIYLKYSILDSTYPTTLTIQKSSNNNYATVTFSQSPITGKGGSVTYRVYLNDQTLYADTKELVYKVYDTYDNISKYSYDFSEDYTTKSIKYVNTNPPADTIYEYDDYGNLTAKLEIVGGVSNYTLKQKTTEIITGNTDEVRLVRADINYHINNDVIDDKYDNNDIFTTNVEKAIGKAVKVGETIDRFYLIPEVVPTQQNSCPYIFKGWYYDKENDNDSHPVQFGTDKYAKDIYAHWIKVEDVAKDENDKNIVPYQSGMYGGFDLAGVQIRRSMFDTNFGKITPGGMRFITSLSMDVVDEINKIKPNNIEYGYVAAKDDGTSKDWIDYHDGYEKLQYVSDGANGINTTNTTDKDKDYFGFAHNVDCTSRVANSSSTIVPLDHQNYDGYLLYSLVINYDEENPTGYDTKVLARPYIHYTDANGSERVAYSEYLGNANKIGGCYISYNDIAAPSGN